MSTIQESAELLTEEGKLLQSVQGHEDYEIDSYASRLEAILERKSALIDQLSEKLRKFRKSLAKEEVRERAQCPRRTRRGKVKCTQPGSNVVTASFFAAAEQAGFEYARLLGRLRGGGGR